MLKMADKTTQNSKKKTLKELNLYNESGEKRINYEEKKNKRIIQVDPKLIVESLKAEEESSKLIVRVDKLSMLLIRK